MVPDTVRTDMRLVGELDEATKSVLAAKLVNELFEAADERVLSRRSPAPAGSTCSAWASWATWSSTGAAPSCCFRSWIERKETNSVAIASNESFSGWTKTFTDPRLCAAIVDRLTFGGNIIETGTTSYRLAHTRAQRAGTASP